ASRGRAGERQALVRDVLGPALVNNLRAQLLELESVFASNARVGGRRHGRKRTASRPAGGRVLVVHGRNEAAREKVARFLIRLGFEPIILGEVPGRGRTLIEKLDEQS